MQVTAGAANAVNAGASVSRAGTRPCGTPSIIGDARLRPERGGHTRKDYLTRTKEPVGFAQVRKITLDLIFISRKDAS